MEAPKKPAPERAEPVEQLSVEPEILGTGAKFRVIGVFMDAYILVEADRKLIMIDQHAAHERILFEKFQREIGQGVAMQTLIMPEVFPATPRETAIVADNLTLNAAGAAFDLQSVNNVIGTLEGKAAVSQGAQTKHNDGNTMGMNNMAAQAKVQIA